MAGALTSVRPVLPMSRPGWVREQSRTLWLVLTAPDRGFSALGVRPSWLVLFLLVFSLNAAFSRPMLPLATRAAMSGVEARVDQPASDAESRIATQVRIGQIVGLVVSPVFLLVKWLACAILLWALVTVNGSLVGLKQMFSLAAHANVPIVLGYFFGLTLALLRGPEAIHGLADLQPRLGLNAFVAGSTPAADVWLGAVGPFDIWFLVLLTIGLEKIAGLPRRLAIGLAAAYWLGAVVLQASLAGISRP